MAEDDRHETEDQTLQPSDAGSQSLATALAEVQQVLFGAQLDEYDKKLTLLDRKLRNFIQTETATLELRLRSHMEKIAARMEGEQGDRHRGDKDLADHLGRLQRTISQSMGELIDRVEKERSALREEAFSRTEQLGQSFRKQQEQLCQSIESGLDEVRSHKADRDSLSGVLLEVATRLGSGLDGDVKH